MSNTGTAININTSDGSVGLDTRTPGASTDPDISLTAAGISTTVDTTVTAVGNRPPTELGQPSLVLSSFTGSNGFWLGEVVPAGCTGFYV